MTTQRNGLPPIVSPQAWQQAIDEFRIEEKNQTRQQDALNAQRRRLPMTLIDKQYEFTGENGRASLLDLFEGRRQLILHHFMFGPAKDAGCVGCSTMVDNMGHPAHLHARDVSRVLVSRAPYPKLAAFKQRMGWTIPWYSSFDSDFNDDFGTTTPNGEMFGISVFLREGDAIYRTYFTTHRGVEYLGTSWSFLDITPFGRQEAWEDTPEGRPQFPTYEQMRHHDRYE